MQREIHQTIEQLLQAHAPSHLTPHLKITWERGFLTGLLARMAQDNTNIRLQLERELWEAQTAKSNYS
jgi:hypothetical protein